MERPLDTAVASGLLDIWERLASQHVALGGAGCACGVGGVSLQLGDFEQDIVDFLVDFAERNQRADILDFLQAQARAADGAWSLPALLRSLGAGGGAVAAPAEMAELLLAKLGKTLHSFAKLHG
jgi:hypothetical protein